MNRKIKILVCCHKKDIMATQEPYLPIQVGKDLHPELDLGIQGDNTGDNISDKNANYAELTAMYWAWKNLKGVDYIGLCHYRRYFDFNKQIAQNYPYYELETNHFDSFMLAVNEDIILSIKNDEIITPFPFHLRNSLTLDYCYKHLSEDFRLFDTIIRDNFPEVYPSFSYVMNRTNILRATNMFIMKWSTFCNYCNWLFSILSKVEKGIDISNHSLFQSRVFGFMGERLLNVYIHYSNLNVRYLPIAVFVDKPLNKMGGKFHFTVRNFINDLGYWMLRERD